ncbi:pca operon transcription factor PcaQ [Azomonas macrocytogenes]|uniref:LysR family pca operon transcriptional activator n=1 Tax=Azomonas macrocytogenes TaxID=69962 RepID=A0A839TAI5_AZOMA|nr:LysR family pca operon transcriptional activator [Azomonas macrocytogenes]
MNNNVDNRIKYRHLLCFLEVSRQGSLVRAAEALAVSQPAISKTLRELEDVLGSSLFDRGKNGVTLTAAGSAFLRYAGPSVQSLREGVRSLRAGEHEVGIVRVGVLSTLESSLMPEVIECLHAQHAALVISVVTGSSAYLLEKLRSGELDLVVGRVADNAPLEGLTFEHLYSESMTLVVRAGHVLLTGELNRLGDFPVVLPLAGSALRRCADNILVQLGISLPLRRLETLSIALSRHYVFQSDAVWVAPLDAVRQDLQSEKLVELDLNYKEPAGSVGICSNSSLPLSLTAQWCCEALRAFSVSYR